MKSVGYILKHAVLLLYLVNGAGCSNSQIGQDGDDSQRNPKFDDIMTEKIMEPFKLKLYDYRKKDSQPPEMVFYFFHGQGGSESSWEDRDTTFLRRYFRKHRATNCVVVSVSAGPEVMLIPKNSSPNSGLDKSFIKTVMQELDNQKNWAAAKKVLIGFSMGGTSGSYIFFNNSQLFYAAIFISAGHYPFSVFAKDDELKNFLDKNELFTFKEQLLKLVGRSPRLAGVKSVLAVQKRYFGSEKDWDKFFIFNTLEKADGNQQVYISTGKHDSLGLYNGNRILAQRAQKAGYTVTYNELDGGHGAIDQTKVVDFIKSISE